MLVEVIQDLLLTFSGVEVALCYKVEISTTCEPSPDTNGGYSRFSPTELNYIISCW